MTQLTYGDPRHVRIDVRDATGTQYGIAASVQDGDNQQLATYGSPGQSEGPSLIDHTNPAAVAILKAFGILELAVAALSGGTVPDSVQRFIDSE